MHVVYCNCKQGAKKQNTKHMQFLSKCTCPETKSKKRENIKREKKENACKKLFKKYSICLEYILKKKKLYCPTTIKNKLNHQ